MYITANDEYYAYGQGSDAIAKVKSDTNVTDGTQGYDVVWEETFKNGVATITQNGTNTVDQGVTFDDMKSYMWSGLVFACLDMGDANGVTLTDGTDHYIIEFTPGRGAILAMEDIAGEMIFGDGNYLEANYGVSFLEKSVECYTVIDKDTGFVTGTYLKLEGNHVMDGKNYPLSIVSEASVEIGDPDAYYEITGETLPGVSTEKITPALYEVTDGKGNKIYLMGTIHAGKDSTVNMPDKLYEALKQSKALALECNLDNFEARLEADQRLQQAYVNGVFVTDGSDPYASLDEETLKLIKTAAKEFGVYQFWDTLLPTALVSFISNTILDQANGFYSDKGVEEQLTKVAKENNIPIWEVEDIYQSLAKDSTLSKATQLEYIKDSLDEFDRAQYIAELNEMYKIWAEGDEQKFKDYLKEDAQPDDASEALKAAYEEYNKMLLTDRDAVMLSRAKEYLEAGDTVFFAVGAAHLFGETGLVDALRNDGYTVTKVEY